MADGRYPTPPVWGVWGSLMNPGPAGGAVFSSQPAQSLHSPAGLVGNFVTLVHSGKTVFR